MTINRSKTGKNYQVVSVNTDKKVKKFLNTLGLFEGSSITLISKLGTNYILNVKDSRYAIDTSLAAQIQVNPL